MENKISKNKEKVVINIPQIDENPTFPCARESSSLKSTDTPKTVVKRKTLIKINVAPATRSEKTPTS